MTMSTLRTQLRRRKPTINEDEVSIPPSGFVFDLSEDLSMRRVLDRFGKLGSRHAFQVQCFARLYVEFMQAALQSGACISQGRLEQGWRQPVRTLRHRACTIDSGRHLT